MPHLGDKKLLRVFAKHEPYQDGRLGKVTSEMRSLGPPEIRVVEFRNENYAVEGSHRLAAAHHLGLVPKLVPLDPDRTDTEGEGFFEKLRETLPHYTWEIDE